MANAEFIEQWNELFCFKIKEPDLVHPTEEFLFNALLNYLKMLNIDVESLTNLSKDPETRRLEKIKFCQYIDHLYKLSDDTLSFLYFDLLHPSPKKTVHLLKLLLNYLHYYNMIKNLVVSRADELIAKREKALSRKMKFLEENEKAKIKAESIGKLMQEYVKNLPGLNKNLNEARVKDKELSEHIEQLQEKIKILGTNKTTLMSRIEELKTRLILDDDINKFLLEDENIEKQMLEREEIEKAAKENNLETLSNIKKIEESVKKIETILEIHSLDIFVNGRKQENNVNQLEILLKAQKIEHEKTKETLNLLERKIKETKSIIEQKNYQLDNLQKKHKIMISNLETILHEELEPRKIQLENELREVIENLEVANEEKNEMAQAVDQVANIISGHYDKI